MTQSLTILMYHYVRDLHRSRYPRIEGRTVEEFRNQIEYLQARYTVVSGEQVMAAAQDETKLPDRAALLTFDDGYLDHFVNVFPILDEAGLPACFFPPACAVLDRELLDVNKIHFILASTEHVDPVLDEVFDLMRSWGKASELRSREAYREAALGEHRFDEPDVVVLKRMLQRELPKELRGRILDRLFEIHVDVSEEVLAEELYMDLEQCRCLRRNGMYVGSHGDQHAWMDRLDPSEQRADIDRSLEFLREVGTPLDRWIMCYPYGAHDASLRRTLQNRGCTLGLTTRAEVADLSEDDSLFLPRLDTNDVPLSVSRRAPDR